MCCFKKTEATEASKNMKNYRYIKSPSDPMDLYRKS